MAQTVENPPPPPQSPTPPPTPAPARRPAGARRTRVVIRKIGPLSVLKFSLIFYFCVMLILYVALAIIYALLGAVGAIDETERILGLLFSNGDGNVQAPLVIDGGKVFLWLFVGGCVNVIVWSLVNVFAVFLYNLISDLVGGVDVTLAEKH
ncbi:MAG TPA: DUF3566 domain-containing protein [Actinomycetota bacterium]